MKFVLLVLCLALIAPGTAAGQPATGLREVRFTGPSAVNELCACLLELRNDAETQGRLDFTAEVESASADGPADLTARIWEGSAHAVGRINFAGHSRIDDSTLRRAMTIYERDLLLVRPDLHVAWRGDRPPDDPARLAAVATGRAPSASTPA